MWNLKLTSQRQATFPAEVCDALKLVPGARIRLERGVIARKVVYFLRPAERDFAWIGGAGEHAKGKSHRWASIRSSIKRGWTTHWPTNP